VVGKESKALRKMEIVNHNYKLMMQFKMDQE